MENIKLSWKRGFFSKMWNIYRNNRQVGFMERASFFSRKTIAEIDGRKYEFRDKRIFYSTKVEVIDMPANNAIGKIQINFGKGSAYIRIGNEISTLKLINQWKNTFKLHNPAGLKILYNGTFSDTSGKIETNKEDEINLLSGLYVYTAYSRNGWGFLIGFLIGLLVLAGLTIFTDLPILDILRWIF
jgi:hypothetical protein